MYLHTTTIYLLKFDLLSEAASWNSEHQLGYNIPNRLNGIAFSRQGLNGQQNKRDKAAVHARKHFNTLIRLPLELRLHIYTLCSALELLQVSHTSRFLYEEINNHPSVYENAPGYRKPYAKRSIPLALPQIRFSNSKDYYFFLKEYTATFGGSETGWTACHECWAVVRNDKYHMFSHDTCLRCRRW
ncbi:hypothetical protein BJ508DRAFT_95805 [Ascobolus immersus RN42]|uniref:F-box domain-containing protein n=1 Tax=Ascobolus immersus RN42 TaxID=1160509 RepID=A0A3N4IS85_ASCIM|nr:hypothetical protein BJ508DRAFT_95805 [Ascobolus immersus RN42]